jgi:hypothetical protein
VLFQCTNICNDQVRVIGISVASHIYHFFVLGIFEIFSPSYFEIFNELLSTVVILQGIEVILPINVTPVTC